MILTSLLLLIAYYLLVIEGHNIKKDRYVAAKRNRHFSSSTDTFSIYDGYTRKTINNDEKTTQFVMTSFLKNTFLPINYPESVPKEYTKYQMFNLIQDLCSYLRSLMATQSVLKGLGVGRNDITALQATVNWIYRDGAAMIGGLIFTSIASGNFGQNIKSYRLFADIINNIGITLDMIAPYFEKHFLLLVCVGNIARALCGVAAGAVSSSIFEHWGSQNNNIPDVCSKNNAQHTLISLLGLLVSVQFAKYINYSPRRLWSIYSILTLIHIYANVVCMKTLALRSLNISRYTLIIQNVMKNIDTIEDYLKSTTQLSLKYIAENEPILRLLLPNNPQIIKNLGKSKYKVKIWCNPEDLYNIFTADEIQAAIQRYKHTFNSNYLILLDHRKKNAYVCFDNKSDKIDEAKAVLEVAILLDHEYPDADGCHRLTNKIFPQLFAKLKQLGWDTSKILFIPSTNAKTYHLS